jgi:hypothetical protein
MAERGPSAGLIAGIGVGGCLLLACCCFIPIMGGTAYYYYQRQQMDYWSTYDWGTWETAPSYDTTAYNYEEVAWGDLRLIGDPTSVYTTASTTSVVLETMTKGHKVSYYGFDDTGMYYKVKSSAGTMGFVHLNEAEMEIYLGDLRVTATTATIYESNADPSTVLETRLSGSMVPWYGYDSTGYYYKVRTTGDVDGYMKTEEASVPW